MRLLLYLLLLVPPAYGQYKSMQGPVGINESNYYMKLTDVVRIDNVLVVSFINGKPNQIGLAVSQDYGKSWKFVESLIGSPPGKGVSFHQLTLQGKRIYALSTAELGKGILYYSDDKGSSWRAVDENKLFFHSGSSSSENMISDDNYFYVTYNGTLSINNVIYSNMKVIYRISHDFNEYAVFQAPNQGIKPLGTGRYLAIDFVGHDEQYLVFLDSNFQIEKKIRYNNYIYDVVVNGDYIAVLGFKFVDESFDKGDSFSRSEEFPCLSSNTNQSFATGELLFIGSECGLFYKDIGESSSYKRVPPLDFYRSNIAGYFYDKINSEVYSTSSISLNSYRLSDRTNRTFYPFPDNTQITDVVEFGGAIYAATYYSGVWKLQNSRWEILPDGLFIQNYDRIPGNNKSEHYGNRIYKLDTLNFPSVGQVLCAGTSYGLYCLNNINKKWYDVSSYAAASLFGEWQFDYILAGKLAVLSFIQLDESKVLVSYNHQASGDVQNGDELILSSHDMEENFKKEIPQIIDVSTKPTKDFELWRYQKTTLTKLAGAVLKTEGSFTKLVQSVFPVRTGLHKFLMPENIETGHYYSYPPQSSIGKEFLTSDVQAIVKYGKGYAAAVRGAGVYFSESLDSGWLPRNKFLVNQDLTSLAVFNSVLYLGTDLGIYQWDPDKGQWGLVDGTVADSITVLRPYSGGLLVGTAQGVKVLQLKPAGRKKNKVLKYAVLSAAQ